LAWSILLCEIDVHVQLHAACVLQIPSPALLTPWTIFGTPQEIEKLAAKKGVTIQSVKEVLQGLCDDDLVCMEKVGIQNVYVACTDRRIVACVWSRASGSKALRLLISAHKYDTDFGRSPQPHLLS
jgi:hypothetical protein